MIIKILSQWFNTYRVAKAVKKYIHAILVLVYSCLPLLTHVYPMFTLVYSCLPLLTHVYPTMFTLVYSC